VTAPYSAAPQDFTFGGRKLTGALISFSGDEPRRTVSHEFLKRRGARQEDMGIGPRKLDVDLIFVSTYNPGTLDPSIPNAQAALVTAADQYAAFALAVQNQPTGRLDHPIAGQWQAFCRGPQHSVRLSDAVDRIVVRVTWIETELNATSPVDTPDVQVAAQQVTEQQDATNFGIASGVGDMAKGLLPDSALAAVDKLFDEIETADDALESMISGISSLTGVTSDIIGRLDGVSARWQILTQTVSDYVDSSGDIFSGVDSTIAAANTADTILGNIIVATSDLEAWLLSITVTPAGMADAFGAVEDLMSTCLVLNEALRAARPPVILFTFPELTDLVTFCQRRYKTNALARANDILAMNRLPNPAAIRAGTQAYIPAR